MDNQIPNRRLAAILAADVVGYSRMMANNEFATLASLNRHREIDFDPTVANHRGRIVKLIGDGTLVEFSSVVDAVNCAVAIQQKAVSSENTDSKIVLWIGINLGDIIISGDDIYGDGVNIAARLEALSKPGGVCISSIVNESVGSRTDIIFSDGGRVKVKNIDQPLRVLHWHPDKTLLPTGQVPIASPNSPLETGEECPSIAVLPFDNMSGDAEQEYFSDGISEDIITDLSKISGLLVIARNSSFAYKGKSVDLRDIGNNLGVNSILEGSVRRAGNRVRITAQLIDAKTGGHIWANRYDGDLTDIFAVQDEVTLKIVEALKVKLSPVQKATIANTGTKNTDAHDYFLRARNLFFSHNISRESNGRATEYGENAVKLDPNYAQALAGLALCHVYNFVNGWSDDLDGELPKAAGLAARSVEIDPTDPFAYSLVAVVARVNKDLEAANSAIEKALALNPNYSLALFTRGEVAAFTGRPKEAIVDIERAIRIDPGFSHMYLHFLGFAHLLLGNFETAVLVFRERLLLADRSDISRAMLAAALGQLGDIGGAQQIWSELLKINPNFSIDERLEKMSFGELTDLSRITEGLSKAGLPI